MLVVCLQQPPNRTTMLKSLFTVTGGDAGEEVWGSVCVPAGCEDDPDGVQALPHEEEL